MSSSPCCCPGTSVSNLDRFLHCVTPDVPSTTLPQSCYNDLNSQWLPLGEDRIEYFNLKDLWDCFYEWSAYGAGTPVMLETGETLTQFYVPYLSAIQIYSTKSIAASRNRREDNDVVEFESDSWSDDSESDELSRSLSNNSSKAWDAISLDSNCDQQGPWPTRDMLGYIYLDYTERASPYERLPFADKISELAKSHPALMTLRSVDLSPASWMAVAWYPIYPIPSQKNEKDLTTCFLTYHTLSSSFQDCAGICDDTKDICYPKGQGSIIGNKCKKKNNGYVSLSPFGLATYKMQGDIWLSPSHNNQSLSDLYSAAESWLKQLGLSHPDFNFFTCRSSL